ncbi:hypothetical protein Pelo_19303 [Pelomyxa schiedti]|nr:hypothetical protein Pelo_19303 [Pelomyxa schiedti]
MAKELVEGGGESTPWSGCRLLRWPVNDPDVLDDIRAIQCHHLGSSQSVLYDACRGGHLEVVKWVVSKFHGGGDGMASWEIPMPFRVALRWGRMSVVKWLACSTGVVRACRKMARLRICGCDLGHFISSPNLEVLKFCTDLFCGDDMIPPANVCSTEGCEWIKKRFRLDPPDDQYFATAGGTKWAIKSFHLQPTLDDLNFVCADLADQQLVQWMMTKHVQTGGSVWRC